MISRSFFWIGFFTLILLSWSILVLWDIAPDFLHHWGFAHLHHAHHSLPAILGMWLLMVLAMMLPTILPLVQGMQSMLAQKKESANLLWWLVGGYSIVWVGFALPAGLLQHLLQQTQFLSADGVLSATLAMAILLLLAGGYQFSPFKRACVQQCRQPVTFLFRHWRAGSMGVIRLGVMHGLYCIGCCWALMLLAFVFGTMNTLAMGLMMVIMTVEKLPQWGKFVDRPLGLFLTGSGLVLLMIEII